MESLLLLYKFFFILFFGLPELAPPFLNVVPAIHGLRSPVIQIVNSLTSQIHSCSLWVYILEVEKVLDLRIDRLSSLSSFVCEHVILDLQIFDQLIDLANVSFN